MFPATDFLLFGGFSAFPEVLGLFANFCFAHVVSISMLCVVFVFAPGSSWPPRAKIYHRFWRFVIRR